MTLQNRVLPTGEIVADPARGLFMGNRGILHDGERRLGTARWRHKAWICCVLSFKGRRRVPMSPGAYTELFFLDEAVALAAGHRPCAECRRADFNRFRAAWARATGETASAPAMDATLHAARVTRARAQVRHEAELSTLPDGAFVLNGGAPCLVHGGALLPFSPGGYGAPLPRPGGAATVLTPRPLVDALRAGYAPALHHSARAG
jgi:hypothetical protein